MMTSWLLVVVVALAVQPLLAWRIPNSGQSTADMGTTAQAPRSNPEHTLQLVQSKAMQSASFSDRQIKEHLLRQARLIDYVRAGDLAVVESAFFARVQPPADAPAWPLPAADGTAAVTLVWGDYQDRLDQLVSYHRGALDQPPAVHVAATATALHTVAMTMGAHVAWLQCDMQPDPVSGLLRGGAAVVRYHVPQVDSVSLADMNTFTSVATLHVVEQSASCSDTAVPACQYRDHQLSGCQLPLRVPGLLRGFGLLLAVDNLTAALFAAQNPDAQLCFALNESDYRLAAAQLLSPAARLDTDTDHRFDMVVAWQQQQDAAWGQNVDFATLERPPVVTFRAESAADRYALFVYDADGAGRGSGQFYLMYSVINIRGGNSDTGDVNVPYEPPDVRQGQGSHRVVALLVRQRQQHWQTYEQLVPKQVLRGANLVSHWSENIRRDWQLPEPAGDVAAWRVVETEWSERADERIQEAQQEKMKLIRKLIRKSKQ